MLFMNEQGLCAWRSQVKMHRLQTYILLCFPHLSLLESPTAWSPLWFPFWCTRCSPDTIVGSESTPGHQVPFWNQNILTDGSNVLLPLYDQSMEEEALWRTTHSSFCWEFVWGLWVTAVQSDSRHRQNIGSSVICVCVLVMWLSSSLEMSCRTFSRSEARPSLCLRLQSSRRIITSLLRVPFSRSVALNITKLQAYEKL